MKVVLLHAWPLDETMWAPQLRSLRDAGFDVVTPRLYGRGPSIDGWAAELLREIDGQLSRSARPWAAIRRSPSLDALPSVSSGSCSRGRARTPTHPSAARTGTS
jgi:pimeloyl-ACP methyl ester carboxylesterase